MYSRIEAAKATTATNSVTPTEMATPPTVTGSPRITCPTLLLAGAQDRLAPAAELSALAALFPEPARHHVVPGVGHTVAIEAAEVWRAHVQTFLT